MAEVLSGNEKSADNDDHQANFEHPDYLGPNGEPPTWRNHDVANDAAMYDDGYATFAINKAMQKLKCFFCQGSLSVGPFYYEKEHPNNKACGRCFRNPASAVHAREMLQDHMYEKLLAFFIFYCSYCEAKLSYSEVDEHEIDCLKERNARRNAYWMFVMNPDVDKLRETLSCDSCDKPLSVFPVVSNGDRFICGRCKQPSLGKWTEQKIYSNIVGFVKFPCCHSNCTSFQRVYEVSQHDQNCIWATTLCPLGCGRIYPVAEASIHMRRIHLHESVDCLEVKRQMSLFKIEGEPYLVSITAVDEDRISCAVFGLDEKDYESLKVEFVDKDSGLVSHQSVQIQVGRSLRQPFNSTVPIKKNAYLRLVRVTDSVGGLDDESRQRFECQVCFSYMTRTIFKCENGHPICDQCKVRIDQSCPMCRGVLPADDRHTNLEKEAAAFKFPCVMQDSNKCNVTLTPELLTKHEDRCKWRGALRSDGCIFAECSHVLDSDQYNDFFNHCAQHHFDALIYSGSKELFKWSTEAGAPLPSPCESMLFFDGELFYVTFHYSSRTGLFVAVKQLKPKEWTAPNVKSYKCTVELHDNERASSVEWSLPVGKLSFSWELTLNDGHEVVNLLAHVGPTSSWFVYRVKLEEIKSLPCTIDNDVSS